MIMIRKAFAMHGNARIVQITIPMTFWITIRNVFRNVILAHVNLTAATVLPVHYLVIHRMYKYKAGVSGHFLVD